MVLWAACQTCATGATVLRTWPAQKAKYLEMSAKDIAIDAPRPQICMWKLSLAHWPEYLCEAGLVAFFVLADCLITIAVKYPGSPVHSWFLDPLGQRVVIGLGLGTATLLLIKSPLGEASGAHMNPAITLTFFYLGKIRLVDLCFYIIAQAYLRHCSC